MKIVRIKDYNTTQSSEMALFLLAVELIGLLGHKPTVQKKAGYVYTITLFAEVKP